MKPVMTYELAMAAAKDAANDHMRQSGRKTWNVDDWNKACAVFDRLWPVEAELFDCQASQQTN